jgi:hypothetical protein
MVMVKEFFNALYHCLCFKTYTDMPRILEIGYGILAWSCVVIIIWAQFK